MMPPVPTWFTGRSAVVGFLGPRILLTPGRWRLIPTQANGQAAVAVYERRPDSYIAHGVHVLTFNGDRIARLTFFNDPALVGYFGV